MIDRELADAMHAVWREQGYRDTDETWDMIAAAATASLASRAVPGEDEIVEKIGREIAASEGDDYMENHREYDRYAKSSLVILRPILAQLQARDDTQCATIDRLLNQLAQAEQDKAELQARAEVARNEALEEAAQAVDKRGAALVVLWRAGLKSDPHLEGQADASDDYSARIRALINKEPSNG